MHIIEKNLHKAEMQYEKEKNGTHALALFACYVLAGKTIDEDGAYLSKAFHTAVTAHRNDLLDLRLVLAVIHANTLLGNYENAYDMIRALEYHSSFLSKNMPEYYGQALFFYSIVQARTEKIRSAKKIHRNLEILYEKTQIPEFVAYLGTLRRVVFGDIERCAQLYLEALEAKSNNVYLFLDTYELLRDQPEYTEEMNELAKYVIPWALNKDITIEAILNKLDKKTLISILFALSTRHLAKIFDLYHHSGAFQCLCQKLIFEEDTSALALSYYKIAMKNNIRLRGIEQMAVKAAYENHYYEIPEYIVQPALEKPSEFTPPQLAFLFAVLLDSEDSEDLVERHKVNMIKFGTWSLARDYRGKDFNRVYKYLFLWFPDEERFIKVVHEEMLEYELAFKGEVPRRVGVYDYYSKGIRMYDVEEEACYIHSFGRFHCFFLGAQEDDYLNIDRYKVTKLLDTQDAAFYEALQSEPTENEEVWIMLAIHYLTLPALDEEKVRLLERASVLERISEEFRQDICAALADYYAGKEHYTKAIQYYDTIGEGAIKPAYLEGALTTYIAAGNYDAATAIITKKHYALADKVVFDALQTLHEKADTLEIAAVCYRLIMNDLCSEEILDILLRRFKGTGQEWLTIANKIDSLGFDVTQLYEKIIVDGIFTGSMGNDCNEAFIKLYYKNKNHSIIPKYSYFCCYEIIRNGKLITRELADVLEELYFERGEDRMLCYALATYYVESGRQDKVPLISEAAMYLEEEKWLLPALKKYQDKSFISSYIEKNTPFVYYQTPYRNVNICFRTSADMPYVKRPMRYFRFGMYLVNLTLFYDEEITYYFEEEGGAQTEPKQFKNNHMRVIEQFRDTYYTINNAIIYENMMKYDMVERLIEGEFLDKEDFSILTL